LTILNTAAGAILSPISPEMIFVIIGIKMSSPLHFLTLGRAYKSTFDTIAGIQVFVVLWAFAALVFRETDQAIDRILEVDLLLTTLVHGIVFLQLSIIAFILVNQIGKNLLSFKDFSFYNDIPDFHLQEVHCQRNSFLSTS
jgi:hypothetical protein